MKIGNYTASSFNFGMFALDGGAMFGSVPKTLWSKLIPSDDSNRIPLATRCLVLRGEGRVVIVDVGMGEKWSDKQRSIYDIHNTPTENWAVRPDEVTDVILTHLHFDHAGGITYFSPTGEVLPTFPHARIHLQKAHWEYAQSPGQKDKASYILENINPLAALQLKLHDGTGELLPGIWGHCVDGHTKGQQWIEVRGDDRSIMVATDVVPTSHHLPLPYHMGYDICAETILREKREFLEFARKGNHIVFFEHDSTVAAVTVELNDRGHYGVASTIPF
jgi:glyoxylase-like metal-dependent hydrolase (beta-lactamase superfamily II)